MDRLWTLTDNGGVRGAGQTLTVRQDHLSGVDGLRAVAMTMVIAQHCGLLPFGWTGVWLFYVISGYVISRSLRSETAGSPLLRLGRFLKRRLFRIVPVYLVYLLLTILPALLGKPGWEAAWLETQANRWGSLPYLLSFTFNWYMGFDLAHTHIYLPATEHLWTLSVEQQFYLVFPLLFLWLRQAHFRLAVVALIAAGPLFRLGFGRALGLDAINQGDAAFLIYAASVCHFDAFLVGAAIADREPWLRDHPEWARRLAITAIAALAVYASAYLAVNRALGFTGVEQFRNIASGILFGQGREIFVYSVIDLLAAAALVAVLLRRPVTTLLGHPALALVGRISYGGYLYHALVLSLLVPLLPARGGADLPVPMRFVLLIAAWSVTVVVAFASHRWFESPIIAWSKTPNRSAQRASAPALAASAPALPHIVALETSRRSQASCPCLQAGLPLERRP